MQQGYNIHSLLNFINKNSSKSLSHGLPAKLILTQAKLIQIPIIQKQINKQTYTYEFKNIIKQENIKGVVFGDIYLQEHKTWIDNICNELQIKPIMPLWGMDTSKLLDEFIEAGFEAIIVTIKADLLDKNWLGYRIDKNFKHELNETIDPCGERGEFHTFVTNSPLFKKQIIISKTKQTRIEDRWLLEILDWYT
jgi:uncharacterized protein (TIGR00290 family)